MEFIPSVASLEGGHSGWRHRVLQGVTIKKIPVTAGRVDASGDREESTYFMSMIFWICVNEPLAIRTK